MPIASLRPYPGNPRIGSLEAIRESLERHGQYRPIVVRRGTGEVLAGNHTMLAAIELGWQEIAATFVDVDDDQARRIVLVDNRTTDLAGYDDSELAALLQALPDFAGTGWSPQELDRLLDELAKAAGGGAERDTEPAPRPTKPLARLGDLWRLGEHRLLCGDAASAEDVDRVLDSDQAEVVWTDPPYGVSYVGKTAEALTFTGDQAGAELELLLRTSLELALERTAAGGAIYLAHGPNGAIARRTFEQAGWELHQVLIWVKSTFALSRHDYHWQHEPVLYGWKPGAAHRWQGGRQDTTVVDDEPDVGQLGRRELVALVRRLRNARGTDVIREDKPHASTEHPTMKPVGLVAHQIANSSRRGDVVLDPFCGSGTTLIACENLGRRARAIEIDPGYCDVTVDRWQRHTGRQAELERRRRRARAAV